MLFFTKDASLRKASLIMAFDKQLGHDLTADVAEREPFVTVTVRNPRTHISRETALYTDYEISLETNNIAFSCATSCVRRRYSDFQWLRKRLITNYNWIVRSPPEIPPKRLFGRFKRQFLKHRQRGLQRFIEEIIQENAYLSDVALHLFLQSNLPVEEIESHLNGKVSGDEIDDALESPGKKSGLSRSVTNIEEMPKECEINCEHDSGCCYSTTSSINDLMHTTGRMSKDEFRYYVSLPANLDKVSAVASGSRDGYRLTAATESELSVNIDRSLSSLHSDSGHIASESGLLDGSTDLSDDGDEHDGRRSIDDELADYDADDEFYPVTSHSPDVAITSSQRCEDCNDLFLPMKDCNMLVQNLELLLSKPRLTDRLLGSDDESDDCFHESEYDVICSRDDLTQSDRKEKASLKARCHSYSGYQYREGDRHTGMLLNEAPGALGESQGSAQPHSTKVRSLPNIRFPLKRRKREITLCNSELLLSNVNQTANAELLPANATVDELSNHTKSYRSDEESLLPRSDLDSCSYAFSDAVPFDSPLRVQCPPRLRHLRFDRRPNRRMGKLDFSLPGNVSSQRSFFSGRFCVTTISEWDADDNDVLARQLDNDVFPSIPVSAESLVSSLSSPSDSLPSAEGLSSEPLYQLPDMSLSRMEFAVHTLELSLACCPCESPDEMLTMECTRAMTLDACVFDDVTYRVIAHECLPQRGVLTTHKKLGSVSNLLETYDDIADDPVLAGACDLDEYEILDALG